MVSFHQARGQPRVVRGDRYRQLLDSSLGAAKPADCVGPEPAAAGIEEQDLGWMNKCGAGNAGDTITSGLEGAWTTTPVQWSMNYLQNLFAFEWVQTKSPAGATQWIPDRGAAATLVPDAHDSSKRHAPIMFTTDLALKFDPEYRRITSRWLENPEEFELAFAKAWFKLTHRDMGPRARYLGSEIRHEAMVWQDPVPVVDHELIDEKDIANLKGEILDSGMSTSQLVSTAWASSTPSHGSATRTTTLEVRSFPGNAWGSI